MSNTSRRQEPFGIRLKRFVQAGGPFLGLALVCLFFVFAHDEYGEPARATIFKAGNLKTVLVQTVIVGIGALGMTLVIVAGGIDLSAGSAVAFCSVLGAKLVLLPWGAQTFSLDDLRDAGRLAGRIKGSDDPVARFLREGLSAPTLAGLREWTPAVAVAEPLQAGLVADLNHLIAGPAIYETSRFGATTLRPEVRDLLALKPAGEKLARLNRLLLEDAFPAELAPTRTWPTALVIVLVVAAGAGIGFLNGITIAGLRLMPFIVTLGMMSIVRGAAKWLGKNQTISIPVEAPVSRIMFAQSPEDLLPLPAGVWWMLGLAVVTAIVLRQSVFGRHIFALGSNEATARLCGVRVSPVKIAIYTLAGLFFGLAGVMQLSRLTQGDPTVAVGLELDIIAAVVIGGASLSGGTGSILGAVVGALLMALLRNGTNQLGWPNYVQEIIIGGVIVLAVALDKWRQGRRA